MKLLIVDDEIVTTEVLKEQIDREYLDLDEIYTAYNVSMAKRILEEQEIEIVLCDVEMPQANGLELLEWVRRYQNEVEFLFLTSHEKFEYAFGAMKNGAANYLLKPIDIPQINQAIFAVVEKIKKKKLTSEIESYWNYGKRRVVRDFWRNTVLGEPSDRREEIRHEITKLGLKLDPDHEYTLVLFHLRKEVIFDKQNSKTLNWFILNNILAETLTADFRMENIINWEDNGEAYAIAVLDQESEEIRERVDHAVAALKQYYKDPVYAGYISERKAIYKLGQMREEVLRYDRGHVYDSGEIFLFSELGKDSNWDSSRLERLLDQKFILQCLERGERVKLLEYLQKIVGLMRKKDHSRASMQYFQMELMRIVGLYLSKNDMDLQFLFSDPAYIDIQKKALTSEFGMIRWIAYYINKVFDCTPERKKGPGITDVMVDYIRNHYEEPITRNTLADLVHLSPEYVGKIFKKDMGVNINDYINHLRIHKAKYMILSTNYKLIDIALMVGFENMPYFSSVFKKYEGISPAEYKKNNSR